MLRTQGVFLLCESEVEASQCNAQVLGGRITIHEGQTKAGSIKYWENEKGWQTTVRKKKKEEGNAQAAQGGKKKKEGGEKKAWKRGENVEQHKSGARGGEVPGGEEGSRAREAEKHVLPFQYKKGQADAARLPTPLRC